MTLQPMQRQDAGSNADRGFTLIELLVVVMIIGILAAIAIPTFFGIRERAWRSQLTTDVRHLAFDIELLAAGGDGTYPADWPAVTAPGTGVDTTSYVATGWTYVDGGGSFCLAALHPNLVDGGVAVYDGALGGMQPLLESDLDPSDNC